MSGWNEADHPRVPGGKTAGGQFTSKGQDSPFKGKRQTWGIDYETHQSDELDDAMKEQFLDYFEGSAQLYLSEALKDEDDCPITYLYKDGKPYAFFQGEVRENVKWDRGYEFWNPETNEDVVGNRPYVVRYLGSAGPGGGSAALLEAIGDAGSSGATGFYLDSATDAVGFYEKMGMHRGNRWSTVFCYTKDELDLIYNELIGQEG